MSKIKVALRTRPLSVREIDEGYPIVVEVAQNSAFITDIRVPEKPSADSRHRLRKFDFDHTFWLTHSGDYGASQEEVYNEMGPCLEKSVLEGYNACLLAYGQSGTGKTHTMLGTKTDPGLIPRLCQSIWNLLQESKEISSFRMEVSFMEIYREKVRDLLTPDKQIKLREHPQMGPHVQDLTKVEVTEETSLTDLLWEGEKRRAMGQTGSNRRSSRSHAIWTISISQNRLNHDTDDPDPHHQLITNQVHLVDLAGSEKAELTSLTVTSKVTSKNLLAEGADINRSLVSLGNVISSLAEKAQHIPYRDSALTWLLKDSVGGNATTSIIITASPASCCHAQTLNSLRFAQRARLVENLPTINLTSAPVSSRDSSLSSLFDIRRDIARLANILKVAQSNGGILRGLTPRNGWNRLIEAIESWNHVEKKNFERTPPPPTSTTSTETSTSTTITTSASTMTSTSAKSLNDVMVQRNQEYNPADIQCYEDARACQSSSVSVPNSPCHQKIGGGGVNHNNNFSSSSEEVFMPKSSSIKCLTWSQSEIESVPEVNPSDSDDEFISPPQTPHVHHLKNVFAVHLPVTHNLDVESRMGEKIHSSFEYPSPKQAFPVQVKNDDCANNNVVIRHRLPTLVNSQPMNIFEHCGGAVSESTATLSSTSNCSHSNSPCGLLGDMDIDLIGFQNFETPKPRLVLTKGAGKKRIHRSSSKIKEFVTAKPVTLNLLESTDECEFSDCLEIELNQSGNKNMRTVNFQREVKLEDVQTPMLDADDHIIAFLHHSDSTGSFGCDSGRKKCVGKLASSSSSSSSASSSYASLIFQKPVGAVKVVECSKCEFVDDNIREFQPKNFKSLEKRVAAVSVKFGKMSQEDCNCEEVDEGSGEKFGNGERTDLGMDGVYKKMKKPLDGSSQTKFRNFYIRELQKLEQIGKQIKSLQHLAQRYDVLKPYLKKIEDLQKEDFSQPDPRVDEHIEHCSSWNVDIEFNKVQNEVLAISKILKNNGNGLVAKLPRRDSSSASNHSNLTSSTSITSDSYSPTNMDPLTLTTTMTTNHSRRGSCASSNVFELNPNKSSSSKSKMRPLLMNSFSSSGLSDRRGGGGVDKTVGGGGSGSNNIKLENYGGRTNLVSSSSSSSFFKKKNINHQFDRPPKPQKRENKKSSSSTTTTTTPITTAGRSGGSGGRKNNGFHHDIKEEGPPPPTTDYYYNQIHNGGGRRISASTDNNNCSSSQCEMSSLPFLDSFPASPYDYLNGSSSSNNPSSFTSSVSAALPMTNQYHNANNNNYSNSSSPPTRHHNHEPPYYEPWKNSSSSGSGSNNVPAGHLNTIYSCPTFKNDGYSNNNNNTSQNHSQPQQQQQRYPSTMGQFNSPSSFFVPAYSQFGQHHNNYLHHRPPTGYSASSPTTAATNGGGSPDKISMLLQGNNSGSNNNINGVKSSQFNFPISSSSHQFDHRHHQPTAPPSQQQDDPSHFLRQDYGFRLDHQDHEHSTEGDTDDFSSSTGPSHGGDDRNVIKYFSQYGSSPHKFQTISTSSPYRSLSFEGSSLTTGPTTSVTTTSYCKNCSTEFCSCEESPSNKMNGGDHDPRMMTMGLPEFVTQANIMSAKHGGGPLFGSRHMTRSTRSTNIFNPSTMSYN